MTCGNISSYRWALKSNEPQLEQSSLRSASVKVDSVFNKFSNFYDTSKQFFIHSADRAKFLKSYFPVFPKIDFGRIKTSEKIERFLTHEAMVGIFVGMYHVDIQGVCGQFAKAGKHAILSLKFDEFNKKLYKLNSFLGLNKGEQDFFIIAEKIKKDPDPELLNFFRDLKTPPRSLKEEIRIGVCSGEYKIDQLKENFINLKNYFLDLQIKKPIVILASTYNHTINISYNPIKNNWILIDANLVFPLIKNNVEGILDEIFRNYSSSGSLAMSFEISCAADQKSAENYMKKFTTWKNSEEYKNIHNLKSKSLEEKNSWLHVAAQSGDIKVIQELIAAGADVNKADKDGRTSLQMASEKGNTEIVSKLIAAGADVNKANKQGVTPLWVASQNGHTETVSNLIAVGADVNKASKDGATPLWMASYRGYAEIVSKLIAAGADVNKAPGKDMTPLSVASYKGHTETVMKLIDAGRKKLK